jgi:hypothetical protein
MIYILKEKFYNINWISMIGIEAESFESAKRKTISYFEAILKKSKINITRDDNTTFTFDMPSVNYTIDNAPLEIIIK